MMMTMVMKRKQGVDGNMVETLKRKLEEERQKEEEEAVVAEEEDRENEEPVKKKIMVEQVIVMLIPNTFGHFEYVSMKILRLKKQDFLGIVTKLRTPPFPP